MGPAIRPVIDLPQLRPGKGCTLLVACLQRCIEESQIASWLMIVARLTTPAMIQLYIYGLILSATMLNDVWVSEVAAQRNQPTKPLTKLVRAVCYDKDIAMGFYVLRPLSPKTLPMLVSTRKRQLMWGRDRREKDVTNDIV